MKYIYSSLLLLTALLGIIYSCSKEDNLPENSLIVNRWEVIQIGDKDPKLYFGYDILILEFTADKNYSFQYSKLGVTNVLPGAWRWLIEDSHLSVDIEGQDKETWEVFKLDENEFWFYDDKYQELFRCVKYIPPPESDYPSSLLVQSSGYVSGSTSLQCPIDFKIKLKASKGLSEIKSVDIRKGSLSYNVNNNYISINGVSQTNTPGSTFDVTGSDSNGFEWDIQFHEGTHPSFAGDKYFVIVTDAKGLADTIVFHITPVDINPFVWLFDGPGYHKDNDEILFGSLLNLRLLAKLNCNKLKALTVYQDGNVVDFNHIQYDGSGATSNPSLLFGSDRDSINREVKILVLGGSGEKHLYKFEVQDFDGEKASTAVNITIK